MIIVKTKNGDRFINDKAVAMVEHERERAVVNAYGANGDRDVFFHIEDVEGIIYTNDAQPTSWKDEGSEIQRLMKSLDEQREWGNKMRDEYLKIEQERDELKERVAQLEPKAAPDRWWPDNVDSAPISLVKLKRNTSRFTMCPKYFGEVMEVDTTPLKSDTATSCAAHRANRNAI